MASAMTPSPPTASAQAARRRSRVDSMRMVPLREPPGAHPAGPSPAPGLKWFKSGPAYTDAAPPPATPPGEMRAILFDIDGTLVRTGGAGKAAMEAALCEEFGVRLNAEEVPYSGRTDRAIGRDLLTA